MCHHNRLVGKIGKVEWRLEEMRRRCLGGGLGTVRERERGQESRGKSVGRKVFDGVRWVWKESLRKGE